MLYDVIIIGGGSAGLLVASRLSRTHKVLVIEQHPKIITNKAWITSNSKYECDRFVGALGHIEPFTKASLLDGNKFLVNLAKQVWANNSRIVYRTKYLSHKIDEFVVVKTNKSVYRARLLIDTRDVASDMNCIMHGGVYGGSSLESFSLEKPLCLMMASPENTLCFTYEFSKTKKNPLLLREKNNEYVELLGNPKLKKELFGKYSFSLEKNATERYSRFGDSILFGTPLTSIHILLRHYKAYSNHIHNCLVTDRLDDFHLEFDLPHKDEMNRRVLYLLFVLLRDGKNIHELFDLDLSRVILMDLSAKEVHALFLRWKMEFGIHYLLRVLPIEDILIVFHQASIVFHEWVLS